MRKVLTMTALAALAFLLLGQSTVLSQNYEEGELDAWQAIAETYYTAEGLADENFFTDTAPGLVAAGELDERYGFRSPDVVQPGMFVPDFTLMTLGGVPVTLSQYRGEKFVLLINGSWY